MHVRSLFIPLLAFWLLLSGQFDSPILVGSGVVCCALAAWISHRMLILDGEAQPTRGAHRFLMYLPWLFKQIVMANLEVARIVWSPRIPISPRLLSVPSKTRTALGTAVYANSITLTPGTVTIKARQGELLVHALTEEAERRLLSGEMHRRVLQMEGTGE